MCPKKVTITAFFLYSFFVKKEYKKIISNHTRGFFRVFYVFLGSNQENFLDFGKSAKLIFRENQKEKRRDIVRPNKKIERNYMANLTLSDARIWFRYRSQILENIKGNRSSNWVDRMHCRHCTTGLRETQKHIEECTFFRKYRETLDLTKGEHKLIFWRRVTRVLKDLKIANKDMFDHTIGVINPINDATRSETCSSEQGRASPVSDEETRTRGREGLWTSAGVATSGRDMSVGEAIFDHPP